MQQAFGESSFVIDEEVSAVRMNTTKIVPTLSKDEITFVADSTRGPDSKEESINKESTQKS